MHNWERYDLRVLWVAEGFVWLGETVFSVNYCFLLVVDCFGPQKIVQKRIFFARVVLLVGFFKDLIDQQQMVSSNARNCVIVMENLHSEKSGCDKHQLLASCQSVNTRRVWLQNLRLKITLTEDSDNELDRTWSESLSWDTEVFGCNCYRHFVFDLACCFKCIICVLPMMPISAPVLRMLGIIY